MSPRRSAAQVPGDGVVAASTAAAAAVAVSVGSGAIGSGAGGGQDDALDFPVSLPVHTASPGNLGSAISTAVSPTITPSTPLGSCGKAVLGPDLARELEQERQRTKDLEQQIRELVDCVEKLGRQVENEIRKSTLAQQRADAAEEQQVRFSEELERERQRAQRLEDGFQSMTQVVEQLTMEAQETAAAAGEHRHGEAEHHCKTEEYLALAVQENERRAEATAQREAGMQEVAEEQRAWLARHETLQLEEFQAERRTWSARHEALQLEVGALSSENCELHERAGAAEVRSEALARDKERLAQEVMKAMAALAEQKRDLEAKLSVSLQASRSAVSMARWMQKADADAMLGRGAGAPPPPVPPVPPRTS